MKYLQKLRRNYQAYLLFGLSLIVYVLPISTQAAPIFEEVVNYEVALFPDFDVEDFGGQVLDTVVTDLNSDGFLDIAGTYTDVGTPSADYATPAGREGVVIFLNQGDGTYEISSYIPYEENLLSINATDFNGDGDIDLATVNSNSDEVTILINNGIGLFSILETLDTGVVPEKISSADFNGDGFSDFVITVDQGLQVFINNGDATFTAQEYILTSATPSGVTTNDFDGDGDIDFIAGTKNGVGILVVSLNNGDGLFETLETVVFEPELDSAPEFHEISSADVDGDGDVDIIASVNGTQILLNDGNAIFSIGQKLNLPGNGLIILSDYDADGDLDIISANDSYGKIFLYINEVGAFGGGIELLTVSSSIYFKSISFEELDGDGLKDLVISSEGQPGILVVLQSGQVVLTPSQQALELITDVIDFELPNNVENSYLANLYKVEGFIGNNQTIPAINQLNAFINKVNQDFNQERISQEQLDVLISSAQQLISDLQN